MTDSIPDLKFERIEDGFGEGLILLTQDDNGDPGRVAIHPLHLRYMAERFGLVKSNNAEAVRIMAQQARRIASLANRLESLADMLTGELEAEALARALAFLNASAELAREFVADLDWPAPSSTAAHEQAEALPL